MIVGHIGAGNAAAGNNNPEHSLRFRGAASAYIEKTLGAPTNRNLGCISLWIKRGTLSAAQGIFAAGSDDNNKTVLRFAADDRLEFISIAGAASQGNVFTARVFRDPSSYVHLFIKFDFSNGTAGNRLLIWVDGVSSTLTVSSAITGANLHLWNTASIHRFMRSIGTVQQGDGYLSRVCFIDGVDLSPSSFGEVSATTGEWVSKSQSAIKAVVDAGGANSFMLDFNDGTSLTTLGNDFSSKNNDWTLNNHSITAGVNYDWMIDVPGNSFCTLNPLATAVQPVAGNLQMNSSSASYSGLASIQIPVGKWYWECIQTAGSAFLMAGIVRAGLAAASPFWQSNVGYAYYAATGEKFNNGAGAAYGAAVAVNDVVGVAFDATAGTLTFYKNNVSQGVAFTGLTQADFFPAIGNGSGVAHTNNVNFGQRPFAYTPPTGFQSLCQANLPEPTIAKGSDQFNIALATGASIKATTEALFPGNFLEWIKDRANANNHQLIDTVRGTGAVLQSNTTAAETTYSAPSGSSVGWAWKAGGAAVANNAGSIASQVSANTTSGVSVVTFTSQVAASQTIGHGLGIAPKLIITRWRDAVDAWYVYHGERGNTKNLRLNTADAEFTSASIWNNTSPSSTVFTLGSGFSSVHAMAAYCFAEVPGYSKISSYVGNGSADGPFVYCGFKPKFILIKRVDAAADWVIWDAARAPINAMDGILFSNLTNAETTGYAFDVTANGFKIRTASATNQNASGGTYIFAAFAEVPFKYANAR